MKSYYTLVFLLFVTAWVIAPQAANLPGWAAAMAGGMLLWRGWMAFKGRPLPGRWLLTALVIVAVAGTLFTHRTVLGRDAGVTLMVIPALMGLVGSAGLISRIGAGLPSPADVQQPWRRVLRGGILFALTFLLPFVGWFVLPIWALVSGLGAFILSVRKRRPTPQEVPPAINLTPA